MFKEITHDQLINIDGGGIWDDIVEFGKTAAKSPLGKLVVAIQLIEPAYDFGKGIVKGWNAYGN
ncbi:MAG: lactococcin G-beta/enterocin 1071B family bacteriocin [Candidatus Pristimantibacillus lignocellulolyticus]|uniref:Lactococcin G-beta/enterocin 1071B family bacteriocin n=1 Tax=Candidatus Pristimantibacillus lignocellulolyticus TaxID=2994561 RepID=A0A9J6ZHB6_9BACL|nr:MAG: lactococcin G-beta/enterocin 1071B family bacteriocin [Candidatus Pristimantibacillus lignocellulolyticus]